MQEPSQASSGVSGADQGGLPFGEATDTVRINHSVEYHLVRPTPAIVAEARSWAGANVVPMGDACVCVAASGTLVCVAIIYRSSPYPSAMLLTLDEGEISLAGERMALGIVRDYATIHNIPVMISRNLSPSWSRVAGGWVQP